MPGPAGAKVCSLSCYVCKTAPQNCALLQIAGTTCLELTCFLRTNKKKQSSAKVSLSKTHYDHYKHLEAFLKNFTFTILFPQ